MKTAVIIAIIVILLFAAATALAGNYFLKFGLKRKKKKEKNEHLQGELPDNREKENQASCNHRKAKKEVVQWKERVNIEDVSIKSFDGLKLSGELFFPMEENFFVKTHRWVILVHGYSGSKSEMEPFAMKYSEEGYIALCVDCRGHGDSEGEFIGMGYLDAKDILMWISHITAMDEKATIVLHGHSMGGAAVVTAAGSNPPPQLKAVIADCAFSSTSRMFKKQLREWFKLPAFPILNAAEIIFGLRGGYPFKAASAALYAPQIKCPILYIHGDEDKFVPSTMSRELYEKTKAPKEILIFHGAAHAQSQDTDPQGYYNKCFDFINRYASF